ncbi:MAG: AEC family transporter [Oscillospiraceae bacterium]|nr:AEC family transporter [Oscillospiraceae bacterium]MBR6207494.1 AEC family transporter [Oscillospiraceae bacterium]
MNPMALAFNAVFPLLAFMLLGLALGRRNILDRATTTGINRLMFRLCLPLGIFQSIYSADMRRDFDLTLALFVVISGAVLFVLISLAVKRRKEAADVAPVMVQGVHKSNYVLLGLPIAASFFGSEIGMVAVLVAVITPLVNICATIAFESARGGEQRHDGLYYWHMLKKIVLNPLVLSSLLGLLANFSGLKLPAVILEGVISKLAAIATPAAMMALGAGFDFKSMKKWAGQLAFVCLGKLIIMPLILVPLAVWLGIRGANLLAVLIFSGAPTAVNSYSTAVSMGGNEELAGEVVAVTSLLSVFTLFVFLTALGSLGLL